MDTNKIKLNGAIGFLLSCDIDQMTIMRRDAALDNVLSHFPWLKQKTYKINGGEMTLWGHGEQEEFIYQLNDGSKAVLVGSPTGDTSFDAVAGFVKRWDDGKREDPVWDGRYLLLHISQCGKCWSAWNDWCGCVPVYHSKVGNGLIASSLETVVVETCQLTAGDFCEVGVGSMLLNGHYLNDGTLYRQMKMLPPDHFGQWFEGNFHKQKLGTLEPSDKHWDKGWDELCDEHYALTYEAMKESFAVRDSWTVPLSAGLDSRMIAVFGEKLGADMHAVTYGPKDWIEPIYAKKVADSLNIPWERVDMGSDYLADYTGLWADWFGSSLHFHGMYQLPYLEATKNVRRPIMTGFIGDALGGAQINVLGMNEGSALDCKMRKFKMWDKEGVCSLLGKDGEEVVGAVESEMQGYYDGLAGAHYQKMWLTFMRSHVTGFSTYQPTMYDYYQGVGTPFMSRKMTKFTLGLPRVLLEDRRLHIEMIKRYFPEIAKIPGTFANFPIIETGSYLFKRAIAEKLPRGLRVGPFKEFKATGNRIDADCVVARGKEALWPMYESKEMLSEMFDWGVIEGVLDKALAGDAGVTNMYRAIQPLAYRMLAGQGNMGIKNKLGNAA